VVLRFFEELKMLISARRPLSSNVLVDRWTIADDENG